MRRRLCICEYESVHCCASPFCSSYMQVCWKYPKEACSTSMTLYPNEVQTNQRITTYEGLMLINQTLDSNSTALWDAILPSHGLVAVNREWSRERNWPDSMHLPSDDSKNIYLLEAYHQLHCVVSYPFDRMRSFTFINFDTRQKIIRKTFWEAVNRKPYTYNPPHAGHCFDFLRQVRNRLEILFPWNL